MGHRVEVVTNAKPLKFSAVLCLASCLAFLRLDLKAQTANPLLPSLQTYETAVNRMVSAGGPEERGAAIQALAQIASPRYEAAATASPATQHPQSAWDFLPLWRPWGTPPRGGWRFWPVPCIG